MTLFLSNKVMRLLLAVSVSIWMAGGCLFGCSNTTMAAETTASASAESCHARRKLERIKGATALASAPRGMMSECPLLVGSTAAISKNSTSVAERAPIAAMPSFEKQVIIADNTLVAPLLTNRGPTHLLVCVFLI